MTKRKGCPCWNNEQCEFNGFDCPAMDSCRHIEEKVKAEREQVLNLAIYTVEHISGYHDPQTMRHIIEDLESLRTQTEPQQEGRR